ncbi:MAG: ABC transporter substrate-binding protein [Candidatus Binatia bacterium]
MERKGSMATGTKKIWIGLFLLWPLGFLFFVPSHSYGKSAAEVLKAYEGLRGKEREAKLMEGAKREGKMVYYGTAAIDHSKRILDAFKKRYPFMTTGHYRSGAVDVYNKITAEARGKRYDVDVIDLLPGESYTLVRTGLVDPYRSPSREGIRKEFMDREGYWTTIFHLAVALGYNTEYVKKGEAPKSYEDLLNPKWKGKMSLDNQDMDLMGTLIEYWGKEKGVAYFEKLAKNDPTMRRGHTFQAQILAAGEIQVAPWLYGYRPLTMKQQGAPLEVVLLKPVLSVPTYLLLAKHAPHPYSAALFLDWALSRNGGMRIYAEKLGRTAPRPGYKDKFPRLTVPSYLVVDPRKIGPNYGEYTKLYCKIFKHC